MAALRGKICCPHNWHGGLSTYAEAHMVAAIPNRYVLELNMTYNPFKTELFQNLWWLKMDILIFPIDRDWVLI